MEIKLSFLIYSADFSLRVEYHKSLQGYLLSNLKALLSSTNI